MAHAERRADADEVECVTTGASRLEALTARLEEARKAEAAARDARLRVELEIEEARGDALQARWTRAILASDHATAHRCYVETVALAAIASGEPLGSRSLSDDERAEVAAEVERIRGATEAH